MGFLIYGHIDRTKRHHQVPTGSDDKRGGVELHGRERGREPMGVKARSLRSGTLASRSRTVLTLSRGSFLETQRHESSHALPWQRPRCVRSRLA